MISLSKANSCTSFWMPFERGAVQTSAPSAKRVTVTDSTGWIYVNKPIRLSRAVSFEVRGAVGRQCVRIVDENGATRAEATFVLKPKTFVACNRGPYAKLAKRVEQMLSQNNENGAMIIQGRVHRMFVPWGRDHVHTLKAMKYFAADVQSGLDYWLDTQEPDGMFWDCIHRNHDYPGRSWFGEALDKRYFHYDDGGRWIVRRIPVEADCEFLYTEGVWQAWKASGDDSWMARQIPRLEAALHYMTHDPERWSKKHGLVHRAMCMDSWDFINPLYCHGDHRGNHPDNPQFLFHGDNSGLYSMYWRLAEMHAFLGNVKRADELRVDGEALRTRANDQLFFGNVYGHMIPETLPAETVYAAVGDERRRLSLSTGYTLNRRLPSHDMTVGVLREYQRRGKRKQKESFAEWWSMDPPYQPHQWPVRGAGGSSIGEYMNGSICPIVAGELARAAFEHGLEDYGADILRRLWTLSERDGGHLHQTYRQLPDPPPPLPKATFSSVNLRGVLNRGLRNGAHHDVDAWMGEGDNDLRNLPTGKQCFHDVAFTVVDPAKNKGRAVLRLDANPASGAPASTEIAVDNVCGKSLYILHTQTRGASRNAAIARYTVVYADGSTCPISIRNGHEIGHWWGISDIDGAVDRATTRVAWRGANPTWANVGMHVFGWNNPKPDVPVTALRFEALQSSNAFGCVMIAAVSFSDQPVAYEQRIRSHGLPNCWSQAAVYYAIAEGLGGIEDTGRAFDCVRIAPRWAATESDRAEVVLHYPASDTYAAYRYRHDPKRSRLTLEITGAFHEANIHALLPPGVKKIVSVTVDGQETPFKTVKVERSHYADFTLSAPPRDKIVISL